jgi:HK97 family phage major capsid protein
MSDFNIAEVIRPFVDDVDTALRGFEGKAASLESVVHELREEQRAIRRGALFGTDAPEGKGGATAEDKAALVEYVKTGGLTGTTGAAGGFNVPLSIADDIAEVALRQSPVRAVADVRAIDTPNFRLLVNVRGTTTGWVGETATRSTTTAPSLASIEPKLGTVYSLTPITEELLEDFAGDAERWLVQDVGQHLGEAESQAFISGDGVDKPTGFLSGTINASGDGTRTFGHLQHIPTGAASTLGTELPDKLLAMVFSMRAGYRQSGAAWMANTATIEALGKLKDQDNRPLFYPSLREGTPSTLLGYPLVEAEHMPAVASGTFPIAFGAWQRGYTIVDRTGFTVLRDPYTVKGRVQFYVRKRVGGAVRDSNAIKVLKVATT